MEPHGEVGGEMHELVLPVVYICDRELSLIDISGVVLPWARLCWEDGGNPCRDLG